MELNNEGWAYPSEAAGMLIPPPTDRRYQSWAEPSRSPLSTAGYASSAASVALTLGNNLIGLMRVNALECGRVETLGNGGRLEGRGYTALLLPASR